MTAERPWPKALAGLPDPSGATPPTAGPYGSPLRMGQWDQLLMGAFVPMAEDQRVTNTYYGLRHTETWFDLFLRNTDGTYNLISNAVQSPPGGADLKAGPWLPVPLRSSPEGLAPDPRCAPWEGKATQEITPDGKNRYTVPTHGSTDVVSFNHKTLEWMSENGDIQLKGELAAPAMQLILPWREPSGANDVMLYTAQFYKLDGTYLGEPVSGYSMIEHMWGSKNYVDTWWVQNRETLWPYWTTTYDDGTTDMGEMMFGEHGARGALIVNSKGEVIVNTSEFNVEVRDDGGALFTFVNGPQWEFIPEIRIAGFPLAVGMVRRVGETRKVVRSHAMYMLMGKLRDPVVLGQAARPMR